MFSFRVPSAVLRAFSLSSTSGVSFDFLLSFSSLSLFSVSIFNADWYCSASFLIFSISAVVKNSTSADSSPYEMTVRAAVIGVAAFGSMDSPSNNKAFSRDDFPAFTRPTIPICSSLFSSSILDRVSFICCELCSEYSLFRFLYSEATKSAYLSIMPSKASCVFTNSISTILLFV